MSSTIRSRTFCCCLPVRFGVFVMTILGMVGGTLLAVVGWMATVRLQGLQPKSNEIALYIHSVIYTLLGVLSLFGFIGAIVRNRTMVSIFFMALVGHLTFSIFTGAFALYNIFHASNEDAIQQCVTDGAGADGTSEGDCRRAYDIFKGIAVGVFILVWLLEIWGCVIAHEYVGQLDDEIEANGQWPKGSDVEVGRISRPM
jgi:hypothetical protein